MRGEAASATAGRGLETLRTDLANFAILLGGNDGEHLLAPDANSPKF